MCPTMTARPETGLVSVPIVLPQQTTQGWSFEPAFLACSKEAVRSELQICQPDVKDASDVDSHTLPPSLFSKIP